MSADHLHRELAPIGPKAWERIEEDAAARLRTYLAARKLVDFFGPHGWHHAAVSVGRAERRSTPGAGIETAVRRIQPMFEVRVPFELARSELDDAERGATDLELGAMEDALRQIALVENSAVFNGNADGSIVGIAERAAHPSLQLPDDSDGYPSVVARAVDDLRQSGIEGPFGLAIAPDGFTAIVESAEHGGVLVLEHLRTILGGPIVWAPGTAGGIVLSMRGGDFALDVGQDLSIGYRSHTGECVELYVEETFTFRVLEPAAAIALVP